MATKKKKVIKKAPKKSSVKKTVKKSAQKPVKKSAKKTAPKKMAPKKALKKSAKKTSVKKAVAKKTITKATAKAVVKPIPKVNVDYSKAITPLGDRLVVKVVNSERVTAGGLIIPDSASMASGYLKAEVLAVGSGGKSKKGLLRPLDVKVGDSVLFSEHSGTKVNFNAEELQIIHESDVMGIIQN